MDAFDLYIKVVNNRKNLSDVEIAEICEQIRSATGDRAYTIYLARQDGWWTSDNATTCEEIRKAPGDCAIAITLAKMCGWWVG